MKTIFHSAAGRGHVNHGWLDSHHSFSFGRWYDPAKLHFGALRVLNDDNVRGGAGFGTHPHDNMEIISIPLQGALKHRGSTGTNGTINTGDVQIMSAGSGIEHSEHNASDADPVSFLQIWIYPKEANIKPRYEQKTFDAADRDGKWQTVVSPDTSSNAIWINQDAHFSLVTVNEAESLDYSIKTAGNGVYFFVLEGNLSIGTDSLHKRDALGVWDTNTVTVKANRKTELLAIEVPMLTTESLS